MKSFLLITVFSVSAFAAPDFVCKNKEYELSVGPGKQVELKLASGEKQEVKVEKFKADPKIPNAFEIKGSTPDDEIYITTEAALNRQTLFLDYEVKLRKFDSLTGEYSFFGSIFRDCTPKQKVSFKAVR